jgi:hypothetical protein
MKADAPQVDEAYIRNLEQTVFKPLEKLPDRQE